MAVGGIVASGLLALGPSVAQAATETSGPDAGKRWLEWLCMLVFMALCCAIAFKNPKRSHMA
jgi:hypothetical protein